MPNVKGGHCKPHRNHFHERRTVKRAEINYCSKCRTVEVVFTDNERIVRIVHAKVPREAT